jgi:hypothetical protein
MDYQETNQMFSNDMLYGLFLSRRHKVYNNKIALKLKFKAKFKEACNATSLHD